MKNKFTVNIEEKQITVDNDLGSIDFFFKEDGLIIETWGSNDYFQLVLNKEELKTLLDIKFPKQ